MFVVAPKGTDTAILNKLSDAVNSFLENAVTWQIWQISRRALRSHDARGNVALMIQLRETFVEARS
jgi:hypothetical protein